MFNKEKIASGMIVGAIVAAVFVVLVTIFGELFSPIKNWLKDAHHHHWVGKGVWAAILFTVSALITLPIIKNSTGATLLPRLVMILTWTLILGSLILLAFFIYEFTVHA